MSDNSKLVTEVEVKGTEVAVAQYGKLKKANAETTKATRTTGDEMAKSAHKGHVFAGAMEHIKETAKLAVGAAGLAGVGFGLEKAMDAAQAFQDRQMQLNQALHSAGIFSKEASGGLSEYADHLAVHGGYVPPETLEGLTQFVRLTHSTERAQHLMTIATDVSRGAHVSLQRAVRTVTMAEQGRLTGLSRLGVTVTPVTKAHEKLANSTGKVTAAMRAAATREDQRASGLKGLDVLQRRFAGSTDAYSRTLAGASSNLRNMLDILGEKIGVKLVPILTKAVRWLSNLVTQFEENRGAGGKLRGVLDSVMSVMSKAFGVVKTGVGWLRDLAKGFQAGHAGAVAIVGALGGFAAGILIIAGLVKAYQAWLVAQELLNIAMDANPLGLIIVAVATFAGAIVALYMKVGWFRRGVQAVWAWLKTATVNTMHAVSNAFNIVKNALTAVISFVRKHWRLILSIITGPVGAAIIWIVTHFGQIKDAVTGTFNTVKTTVRNAATTAWRFFQNSFFNPIRTWFGRILGWARNAWNNVLNFFKGLPAKFAAVGAHMWDFLKHGFANVINWIVDKFNALPFVGHGIHVGPIHIPGIPKAAHVTAAMGGLIPGWGIGDSVHAMLTPGEFVFRKEAVRALGVGTLNALNNGQPVSDDGAAEFVPIHNTIYLDSDVVGKGTTNAALKKKRRR